MKLILKCLAVCLSLTSLNTLADGDAIALTPTQIDQRWSSDGALSRDGIKHAVLLGDPKKPGAYTIRLSFPADYELPPQSHPDEREVTVLSGVWFTAYGDTFDAAKLKALPAGSWYTEPADVPLYVLTKEPTIIQISGIGPSGRQFIEQFIDP